MPSAILTDGATFTCPHGGTGTLTSTISISALAENVTIGGHKPILAGATISGFTTESGCIFSIGNTPKPCKCFALPQPSGQAVTIDGQLVYTLADAASIALVKSTGNGVVGLVVKETQTLVSA